MATLEQEDIQNIVSQQVAHRLAVLGLRCSVKLIAQGQAELVILASDVNEPQYKALIEAISRENKTALINVDSKEILGNWAGLSKFDDEGEVVKARPCGVLALKSIPSSAAGEKLKAYIQANQA